VIERNSVIFVRRCKGNAHVSLHANSQLRANSLCLGANQGPGDSTKIEDFRVLGTAVPKHFSLKKKDVDRTVYCLRGTRSNSPQRSRRHF
jgi:hypothetical protein